MTNLDGGEQQWLHDLIRDAIADTPEAVEYFDRIIADHAAALKAEQSIQEKHDLWLDAINHGVEMERRLEQANAALLETGELPEKAGEGTNEAVPEYTEDGVIVCEVCGAKLDEETGTHI